MAAKFQCGDVSRLNDLLDDQLTADEQAEMTTHMETCATCRGAFDALAGGSRWLGEVREFLPPGVPRDAGEAETLPTDGTRDGRAGDPTGDEAFPEDAVDFLGPALAPGGLGRFGPYDVSELIGRGGMGVVLKAFDPALHRLVAVKVLAPRLATSASSRKRFTREARAAASVVHEHVVTIHAVDEACGLPYLVMQYVRGASLQERIDRTGPMELKEVLRIGMQAAQGLAAAHAQGLVHRDVKPSNILLENGVERVKLTDFGLARAADDASLTQSGVVAGTPQYMAPEQARGEPVDHRADLFSLGSVLYAMCTGRSPFRAETTVAVLRRVCDEAPRPVREINPEVPERLAALIARLHAKDPADRPQTAAEVAEHLGRQLARLQQPSHLDPYLDPPDDADIPAAKAAPRATRFRGRVGLAAAALVAVLFGGLGLAEATGVAKVSAMLATVLRIPTRDGTLVIQVNDPEVRVDVDGDAVSIRGAGVKVLRLRPGPHQLRARRGGVPVSDQTVTISRGGKQVVRVGLEPDGTTRGAAAAAPAPPPDGAASKTGVEVRRLVGHAGPVRSLAFSADGRMALSGSGFPDGDETMRLWDAQTGKEVRRFEGRTGEVWSVAFSPDNTRALAAGRFGVAVLWDVKTGAELRRFEGHKTPVEAVAFTPDGLRVVTAGDDKTARVWDAETGKELFRFEGHTDRVTSLAVLPDGLRALTGSWDGTARVWELKTGRELKRLAGSPDWIDAVAVFPDGRRALTGGVDGMIRVWDVDSGLLLRAFRASGLPVKCLAVSSEGLALSGGQDHFARLWDPETGREVVRLGGHADAVWAVAFSPDGRRALTGGGGFFGDGRWMPGKDWAIRLWALPGPDPEGPPAGKTPAPAPAPAEPAPVVEVRRMEGHKAWVQSIALSPDGLRAVSCGGDKTVRVWDLATGEALHTLKGHTAPVTAVAFLPGGRRVLSCGWDATLRLWDAETGEELGPFATDPEPIWDLAVSPDGRQVLSAGDEMFLRLRDVESRDLVRRFEGHVNYVKSVAISPDGRRALSGGGDQTARLWDVETGKERLRLEGFGREVRSVAFSPDGRRGLTGSYDGSVRLWDLGDGREVRRFPGHRGTVDTVAFSADGRRAFSAGGAQIDGGPFAPGTDNAVRMWDVSTGRELLRFGAMSGVGITNKVVVAPDGRTVLTGGTDRVVRVWRLPAPERGAVSPALRSGRKVRSGSVRKRRCRSREGQRFVLPGRLRSRIRP